MSRTWTYRIYGIRFAQEGSRNKDGNNRETRESLAASLRNAAHRRAEVPFQVDS